MIVIEGMDGSGKTTLAKKIGETFGMEVVHTGGPTKDVRDVRSCLDRSVRRLRSRVVQDRITHVSEVCYSMLTNPEKAAVAAAAVSDLASAKVIVYCRPPTSVILANVDAHADKEHDTAEHMAQVKSDAGRLVKIYDFYMAWVYRLGATVVAYDYTVDDTERFVRNLAYTIGFDEHKEKRA